MKPVIIYFPWYNTTAGMRQRFGIEPTNVRISHHGGRPVLEYDIVASNRTGGGAAIEVSQHNLWAMLQRDTDGVILDFHVSVTVPVDEAGGADLRRLHDELAKMMGAEFVIRMP